MNVSECVWENSIVSSKWYNVSTLFANDYNDFVFYLVNLMIVVGSYNNEL